MFTGLIETTGDFLGCEMNGEAGKLSIRSHKVFTHLKFGESIAVNGACLTLENEYNDVLCFHVMQETFARTNLGNLTRGSVVNMERAMALGDRFGGHMVSGHVDGIGKVLTLNRVGSDTELKVSLPESLAAFLVPKGSICIDGISLTIASLSDSFFTVRIIPTTWKETNLSFRKTSDPVNLEADMLGKYIHHQLSAVFRKQEKSAISMDDLLKAGF